MSVPIQNHTIRNDPYLYNSSRVKFANHMLLSLILHLHHNCLPYFDFAQFIVQAIAYNACLPFNMLYVVKDFKSIIRFVLNQPHHSHIDASGVLGQKMFIAPAPKIAHHGSFDEQLLRIRKLKRGQNLISSVSNVTLPVFRPIGGEFGRQGFRHVSISNLVPDSILVRLGTQTMESINPLSCVHTLEVADRLHRYGSYLRPYYAYWKNLNISHQSTFFEWLDSPTGREVSLSGSGKTVVSRRRLDGQRVTYCDTASQRRLEAVIQQQSGRLVFRETGEYVNTNDGRRWIFVIDEAGRFYVHPKEKGRFHHSSFLSGRPVLAAGRLHAQHGFVTGVSAHSGHYQTPVRQLVNALGILFGDACIPILTSFDGASTDKSSE